MDRKLKVPNEHLIKLRDANINIELAEDLLVKVDEEKMRENLRKEKEHEKTFTDIQSNNQQILRDYKG